MKPSQSSTLALLAVVFGVLGWSFARVWRAGGGPSVPVPAASLLLLLAIAVTVLVAAWPVRRWSRGIRMKSYNPLRAARAAVLAKAASHCGAMLTGWYLGQAILLLGDLGIDSLLRAFIRLILGTTFAIGVVVAGLVAERWCRLPDDGDEPPQPTPAA